ncbi:MAG: hypothetical protein C0417_07485 [Chlorobiaceae bacterium]|nr:hypothetical protein [Chlorobiaceae bacterium]
MKTIIRMNIILFAFLISTSILDAQVNDSIYSFYPMHVGDVWEYHWQNWISNPGSHLYYEKKEIMYDTTMLNGKQYYAIKKTNLDNKSSSIYYHRIDSSSGTVLFWADPLEHSTGYDLRSTQKFTDTLFGIVTKALYTGYIDAACELAYGIGVVSEEDNGLGWPYRSTIIYARIDGVEYGTPLSVHNSNNRPNNFQLYQNYPNPFNSSTTIGFSLDKKSTVTLKIFNILGQELQTLISGQQSVGEHEIFFNAQEFSSGVYFYRLQTEDYAASKLLIISK